MECAAAKRWARMSVVNSFLLPTTAALHFNVAFWALVMTNFLLMHTVWLSQLVRFRNWQKVDFGLAKWPLVAFAVLGNLSWLVWDEQLLSSFPS
jgi:hypothetical protein